MHDLNKSNIFIVDEDDDLLSCLSLLFAEKYNVVTSHTIDIFKDKFDSAKILIINAGQFEKLDIPYFKSIKKQFHNLGIIVMTSARTTSELSEKIQQIGVDATVYKPCDADRIDKLISKLIKKKMLTKN